MDIQPYVCCLRLRQLFATKLNVSCLKRSMDEQSRGNQISISRNRDGLYLAQLGRVYTHSKKKKKNTRPLTGCFGAKRPTCGTAQVGFPLSRRQNLLMFLHFSDYKSPSCFLELVCDKLKDKSPGRFIVSFLTSTQILCSYELE